MTKAKFISGLVLDKVIAKFQFSNTERTIENYILHLPVLKV